MESVSTDMPFELDLFHCRVDMLHVFYEFFIFVSASCNLWYSITNKSDMLNYALLSILAPILVSFTHQFFVHEKRF